MNPALAQPRERPASVTIIGGAFLALASFRFVLDCIGWIALGGALALACALGLHAAGLPPGPEARGLSASLAPLLAVAAALGAVIWTVRRPPVLRAFAPRMPQPTRERSLP